MRAGLLAALTLLVPSVWSQSLAGEWDATIRAGGVDVPCRFLISGGGSNIQGTFFNDQELYRSTTGQFENGSLTLNFDYTTSKLDAMYKDGALDGTYHSTRGNYGFHAVPHVAPPPPSANPPNIDGAWEIALKSGKGEDAWQFLVRQNGPEIKASILRIDGDTGTLAGVWRDGKFTLSHFSGARPALLIVTPQADGSLHLLMNANTEYTALRPDVARAKGLAPPTDASLHTGVKEPAQPFQFSFRDLNGKVISNTDARFKNKVVVVNILGSWCPNCHDEAPFLEEMYKKYRAKGVEVVALDFEDADQLKDPARMRAFQHRYGIDYTILGPAVPRKSTTSFRNFEISTRGQPRSSSAATARWRTSTPVSPAPPAARSTPRLSRSSKIPWSGCSASARRLTNSHYKRRPPSHRQRKLEGRSFSGLGLYPNPPTIPIHNPLTDGEADSRA